MCLLTLISYSGFSQAIKIDSDGHVGIGGEPSFQRSLYIHGQAHSTDNFWSDGILFAKDNLYADKSFFMDGDITMYGYSNDIIGIDYLRNNDAKIFMTGNQVKIYGGSEVAHSLYVVGDAYTDGAWIGSDKNLKKDIESVSGASILDKISKLEGKKYKLKSHKELLSSHAKGEFRYDVDTINFMTLAESLASKDIQTLSVKKSQYRQTVRAKYLEKAKKKYPQYKMINDTIGIYVNAPYNDGKYRYGLIAQDVKEVFPELVKLDSMRNINCINYDGFIPLLLEGLKEATKRIEELEKEASKNKLKSATADVFNTNASLAQNAPNPFTEETLIAYTLGKEVTNATLIIYNMNGSQIKSIELDAFEGEGKVTINGKELSAGMYLYTLIANGQEVATKRMILTD